MTTRSPQEALRAAGLALAGEDRMDVQRECARAARFLRDLTVRAVGLAPASDDVAVPAAALELGRALAAPVTGTVAVLDAAGTWPCARELVARSAAARSGLCVSWVLERLAVLTPHEQEGLVRLDRFRERVAYALDGFERVVVDLTGFQRGGELAAALEALDGCVLVTRSGVSTMRQVQDVWRSFPEETSLGVLLTGV